MSKEMRCTREHVFDPEGADVRIAIGERRPANDRAVKAAPDLWAEAPPVIDDRLECVVAFKTAEVDHIIAPGDKYRPDDRIVRGREVFFRPVGLSMDEIQSDVRCKAYNDPSQRLARVSERKADKERAELMRQRQLEEAAELRARAAGLEAAAAS